MLLYNSIRGVGSLSQGFQAKKSGIRQVGFVPPALPYRGGDSKSRAMYYIYTSRENWGKRQSIVTRLFQCRAQALWGWQGQFNFAMHSTAHTYILMVCFFWAFRENALILVASGNLSRFRKKKGRFVEFCS